ncbi:hypothetical protein D3C80_2065910 [compost metagenome]
MINAAKAFEIPDKLRILSTSDREGVAGPGFAFDDFIVDLGPVLLINALHTDGLFFVRTHFVVHHHVQQYRNVMTF